MRVLIVNTSDHIGGAAVASYRLMVALNKQGIKAGMLVRDKVTTSDDVLPLPNRLLQRLHFLYDRFVVYMHLHFSKKRLWELDIAAGGADITSLRAFKKADVIHLAWVNQGMLSLADLRKIVDSGKPIVWTMHDLWPVSSVCHYARGCGRYVSGCEYCPLLPSRGSEHDVSYNVWQQKKAIYDRSNISFVTCSRWLERQARRSGLTEGHSVTAIPNPIDTSVFAPSDKYEARARWSLPTDRKLILFVSQKLTDERKGGAYLVKALNMLAASDEKASEKLGVVLLGGHADELAAEISLPVYPLGYVSGDENLSSVYNAADVFVLPSLEDNLPNTLMEALSCGVPCVGFNVGGIPEMIMHMVNGYVAMSGDSDSLAEGLRWVLYDADVATLTANALRMVSECYSQRSVAERYKEVYRQVLAQKGYNI